MIYTILLIVYGTLVVWTLVAVVASLVKYKAFMRQESSPFTEFGEKVIASNMKTDTMTIAIVAVIRISVFVVLFVFREEIVSFIKQYI